MASHYEVLGVSQEATPAQIKSAYRRRVLQTHPDRAGSVVEFRSVCAAWDVLRDPKRRMEYDARVRSGDSVLTDPGAPRPQRAPQQPGGARAAPKAPGAAGGAQKAPQRFLLPASAGRGALAAVFCVSGALGVWWISDFGGLATVGAIGYVAAVTAMLALRWSGRPGLDRAHHALVRACWALVSFWLLVAATAPWIGHLDAAYAPMLVAGVFAAFGVSLTTLWRLAPTQLARPAHSD